MAPTYLVRSGKAVVDVKNCTVHGRLLNGLTRELDVLLYQQVNDLIRDHLLPTILVVMPLPHIVLLTSVKPNSDRN